VGNPARVYCIYLQAGAVAAAAATAAWHGFDMKWSKRHARLYKDLVTEKTDFHFTPRTLQL